jgi:hypothetical protein
VIHKYTSISRYFNFCNFPSTRIPQIKDDAPIFNFHSIPGTAYHFGNHALFPCCCRRNCADTLFLCFFFTPCAQSSDVPSHQSIAAKNDAVPTTFTNPVDKAKHRSFRDILLLFFLCYLFFLINLFSFLLLPRSHSSPSPPYYSPLYRSFRLI